MVKEQEDGRILSIWRVMRLDEPILPWPWPQTSVLQNCEMVSLSHLLWGTWCNSSRKQIQTGFLYWRVGPLRLGLGRLWLELNTYPAKKPYGWAPEGHLLLPYHSGAGHGNTAASNGPAHDPRRRPCSTIYVLSCVSPYCGQPTAKTLFQITTHSRVQAAQPWPTEDCRVQGEGRTHVFKGMRHWQRQQDQNPWTRKERRSPEMGNGIKIVWGLRRGLC